MKRILMLMVATLMLSACGSNKVEPTVEKEMPVVDNRTAEEREESLRDKVEATKDLHEEYDYETLLNDELDKDSLIKHNGTVALSNPEWFVLVDEDELQPVKVYDFNVGDEIVIEDGKEVTVYGTYDGKDDNGAPTIKGFIIED